MKLVRKNSSETAVAASGSIRGQRRTLWNSLGHGDEVSLALRGLEHYRGIVDDRTADGRTIWVVDSIGDRRLFHIDDDYELTVARQADGAANL